MAKLVMISRQPSTDGTDYDAEKIIGVRWDNISGGYQKRQAGYSLYGYIPYSEAVELVACSGRHGGYDNLAKVFIVKPKNKKSAYWEGYQYLMELAGEKPASKLNTHPYAYPLRKRLLEVLQANGNIMQRDDLRKILNAERYKSSSIRDALRSMVKDGRISIVEKEVKFITTEIRK